MRLLFGIIFVICSLLYLYSLKELHSYSLIASIINVFSYPFGKGLGFGGAITATREYTWDYMMLIGESGIAIILNMMGFVGLFILAAVLSPPDVFTQVLIAVPLYLLFELSVLFSRCIKK